MLGTLLFLIPQIPTKNGYSQKNSPPISAPSSDATYYVTTFPTTRKFPSNLENIITNNKGKFVCSIKNIDEKSAHMDTKIERMWITDRMTPSSEKY